MDQQPNNIHEINFNLILNEKTIIMIDRRNILNIAGVAEYTTLSKPMIYKLICQNKIPFHKLGNRTVFLTEEIDDWVRNDGKMVENLPKLKII